MLFWILVAVLVAGVTLAITRPLTRSSDAPVNSVDTDSAVYKDQLKEVAADAARKKNFPALHKARVEKMLAKHR